MHQGARRSPSARARSVASKKRRLPERTRRAGVAGAEFRAPGGGSAERDVRAHLDDGGQCGRVVRDGDEAGEERGRGGGEAFLCGRKSEVGNAVGVGGQRGAIKAVGGGGGDEKGA